MFLVEGGGVGRRQWQTSMSVPPPGELQDMYLTRPDGEANHGLGAHKSTRTDGGSRKNSSSSGQPSVAPGSDIAEISKTRVCIVRPHQDPNCCGKCSVQKCFRSRRSLPAQLARADILALNTFPSSHRPPPSFGLTHNLHFHSSTQSLSPPTHHRREA